MSLPSAWVERIFDKLTLVYGHQFLSRWDGLALDTVKADWAHELSRYQQNPDAITFGLQNLPAGQPPTVLEFRAICARRPDAMQQQRITVEGSPMPRDLREAFARLAMADESEEPERVRWARRYVDRFGAEGFRTNQVQRETLPQARKIIKDHEEHQAWLQARQQEQEASHAGQ